MKTIKEASRYLDRQAYRVETIRRPGGKSISVRYPVIIRDARQVFNRLELGVEPVGGSVDSPDQLAWFTPASIELPAI